MKNNIIIPIFYDISPHLETDFEIIFDLLNRDENTGVTIVVCRASFRTCIQNSNHDILRCARCYSRIDALYSLSRKIYNKRINRIFLPKIGKTRTHNILFRDVGKLSEYSINDFPDIGKTVYSTIVNKLGDDHRFDIVAHEREVMIELFQAIDLFQYAKNIINDYSFTILYVFNGRFAQYWPFIAAARCQGMGYYTHERGGNINRYLLRKDHFPHSIEYAEKEQRELLESRIKKDYIYKIGESFYKDREQNIDQGWISFTKNQIIGSLPLGFDAKKINIAIFNSTIMEYLAFKEWNNPLFPTELEALEFILSQFENNARIHFYLRAHPNMSNSNTYQTRHLKYVQEKFANVTVIMPEEKIHTYALLRACKKVITFGSTIGVEATYYGIPSILVGHSLYESLGVCYIPQSRDEIRLLINEDLKPKPIRGALIYGYWDLTRGKTYKYYKPESLFNGSFMGCVSRITVLGKIADRIEAFDDKINQFMEEKCSITRSS